MFARRCGDGVFTLRAIGVAVVAVLNAVHVGRAAVVVPVRVLDPQNGESAVNVAGVGIVAAGRADQRELDVRLGVVTSTDVSRPRYVYFAKCVDPSSPTSDATRFSSSSALLSIEP